MEISNWLKTKLQQDIWAKKYRENENETLDEWFERVSSGNKAIKQLMIEKKFLPAGRILANRGLQKKGKKVTFSNCYVNSAPEDNIESIFDCASKLARTFSFGGGVGLDVSKLSPRGAKVNNAAKQTSGAVSFMDLYSLVTELIGSEGRRAALMISMDCSHPDLEEFISVKSDLNKVTKANISIKVTNEFIQAVIDNKDYRLSFTREVTGEVIEKVVSAKEIFNKFAEMNWQMAEPGLLMWDRIESWNLLSEDKNFKYASVNPCA
jgi:ribonucleoside-diphosphate reductase alpha chain